MDGVRVAVFPSPGQVACWSYEQLRSLSFSQWKAEYIIDFTRAVVQEDIDLDGLWRLSDDGVMESLTKLRGIERWTVACFLLFGMGRSDVFPAADIGVQNAVKHLYNLAKRPNETQMREMAHDWAPWRSYATFYLWQSLIKQTISAQTPNHKRQASGGSIR